MKKTRLILIAAMALTLATLLCACNSGGSVAFDKIIDVNYDLSEPVYTKLNKLDALTDAEYHGSSTYFALFTKHNKDKNTSSYQVLSLETLEIIATFEYDEDCSYTVDLVSGAPVFTVTKEEKKEDPTYFLYDIKGDKLSTISAYEPSDPEMFGDDVLIYDDVAYSVDKESGKVEKLMDVPEYLIPTGYDSVVSTDKHFVLVYSDEKVVVLDRQFNRVSSYELPVASAFEEKVSYFVLDNGNLFVQYVVELPADAKDYDVFQTGEEFSDGKKFNLVTILVDAASGKETAIKTEYVAVTVISGTTVRAEEGSQLASGVENLALVAPIVDKRIIADQQDLKFMVLDNKGSFKSAEFVENQGYNMPSKVADNLFHLPTKDGAVLLDKSGKVVKTLNNDTIDYEGVYFVGDKAIYDLEFNSVYNFAKNDATLQSTVDGSVFVKEETESGYKIIMFRDGDQKTVFTYDEDSNEDDDITFLSYGYSIYDAKNKKYSYYNVKGELIDTLDVQLQFGFKSENGYYFFSAVVDSELVYYTLTETAK